MGNILWAISNHMYDNTRTLGPVHIARVVPEQYRYVGSAVYVNALCRQ